MIRLPRLAQGIALPIGLLGAVLTMGASSTACAQSGDLPSAPMPNPNSQTNPYFGSVTLEPDNGEVMPLSLDDAVARGLKNNLGVRIAQQGEKTLHGELTAAVQYFLPTITATGGTGVNEFNLAALGFGPSVISKFAPLFPDGIPAFSLITKVDVTQGQLNYDQTLFSGALIDGYKAARAALQVAHFADESARGETVQQVATAYLAVIAARAQVDDDKALMDADKVLFDQAHAMHEAGTVANLDELRARVQFQQQQQVVVADENQIAKDEILLKREIGIAPGQKLTLTDPAPYQELATRTPEDLRNEAYANRQDYQNLLAQLKETQLVVATRRFERFPTLSFKGNYGVTGVSGGDYHGTLSAVGTLRVPIFQEGTLRGDHDVAKAQLNGADLELRSLRSQIDQQVRAAMLDVEATQKLVQVGRSNVDLATSALSDETDRFNAGVDDNLPLVQAQASLASAQTNLVQNLYQANLAKLRLARVTGVEEQQYRVYLGR